MRPIRTHSRVVNRLAAGACVVAFCAPALINAQPPVEPASQGQTNHLAVAWNEGPLGPGKLQLMRSSPPWLFEGPVRDVGVNATLRFANGLIYVVNPTLDTINVFDPDGLQPVITYALAEGCQPRDIAVIDADTAYVTCAGETHLLRLDLNTSALTDVVDLSIFADPDGIPDLEMMELHDGRLFIQLRRIDFVNQGTPTLPPMIAVVDVASETLVDADTDTPGTQAIELTGTPPRFKMQVVPETQRLFVSATHDFFDQGGIEMIDLNSLQSLGLVIAEVDGQTGADLGAFVLTSPDAGYLTYSTDLLLSSHLHPFTIDGGVEPGPDLLFSLSYFVPALVLDSVHQRCFYPQGTPDATGVDVFDVSTGERLTIETIPTTGPPTDMVLLCGDECTAGAAIPAVSTYGVLVMALMIAITATIAFALPEHLPIPVPD